MCSLSIFITLHTRCSRNYFIFPVPNLYFMEYIQLSVAVTDSIQREILIAMLAEQGFDAFEETDDALLGYIPAAKYAEADIETIIAPFPHTEQSIAQQNWNAKWEESFQPVVVPGFCTVKAGFHDMKTDTPYEIIITPKMSFGTGHHATTQLMMTLMQDISFNDKTVFDFGTGTGILGILAAKLGAKSVLAADNDEWSAENAAENVTQNNTPQVVVVHGSIENASGSTYDVLLANINRHILLQYMRDMYTCVNDGGILLMSGLLTEDFDMVHDAAVNEGFKLQRKEELNNWIVIQFGK